LKQSKFNKLKSLEEVSFL